MGICMRLGAVVRWKRAKWLASSHLLSDGLWIHQALSGPMGTSARCTAIPIAIGNDQSLELDRIAEF